MASRRAATPLELTRCLQHTSRKADSMQCRATATTGNTSQSTLWRTPRGNMYRTASLGWVAQSFASNQSIYCSFKVPTQWLVHPAKCWGEPQCLRWKGWILSLLLSFFLSNQSHRFQIAHGSYDNWWKILKSYFRSFPLVRWPWVCLGFWLLCGRMRILGRLQVSHCRQHFYLRVKSSMGSW